MKKFPKIVQYRQAIKSAQLQRQYVGRDDDGRAIYDKNKTLGKIKFTGRPKLHGSNGSIRLNWENGTMSVFSRERELSETEDNQGFFKFAKEREKHFWWLGDVSHNFEELIFFGEWCGGSIQKSVALNQLDKMFVIFAVRVKKRGEEDWEWLEVKDYHESPQFDIFSICRGPRWEIEVDLDNPALVVNDMIAITEEVEKECPFGKAFGVSGIGEGVVWCADNDFNLAFKVKGEAHSKSKIKKLPTVDIEHVNNVNDFVDKHVHEDRLEQGYAIVVGEDEEKAQMKTLGDYIRWVNNDVWEEEGDEAEANGLSRKDIGSRLATVARLWFTDKINTF